MLCDVFSGVLKVSVWPCTMIARSCVRACNKNWLQSETSLIEAAKNTYSTFKWIVNPEVKIQSPFTHSHKLPNLNDLLFSPDLIWSTAQKSLYGDAHEHYHHSGLSR